MLKLFQRFFGFIAVHGALALVGCATVLPSGPDVVGVPSAGKDVAQFRQDEAACRSDAGQQIRAEIGVRDPLSFQQRYDLAYTQCLASKGDTVRPGRTPARDVCGDDDLSQRGPLRCAGRYVHIAGVVGPGESSTRLSPTSSQPLRGATRG